jgi:hypothetical protein
MKSSFFNIPIPPETRISLYKNWGEIAHDIYASEQRFTETLFKESHLTLIKQYPELMQALDEESLDDVYIPERMFAAMRASIHDLLRYATYHDIEFNHSDGRYVIGKSVRAGILLKWMMTFRPYVFDSLAGIKKRNLFPESEEKNVDIFTYSNEIAAIIYSNHALGFVGTKDAPIPASSRPMKSEELITFLYTLRYRIKHQDTYHSLLRRVVETQ